MDVNTILMTVAAVLMLISAILYFVTTLFGKGVKKTSKIKEKALGAVADCSDGEFRLMLAKYLKESERAQKELVEVVKSQNTLIQTEIENLEHEIYLLSEKQVNHAKSIIKYNKENARQLAISERETLEYVMSELKKAIEDKVGTALEEVSGEELFEVSDLPADEEFVLPDLPAPEEIPEDTDDFDLSALFEDIAEAAAEENAPAEPAPAAEEIVPEELVHVVEEMAPAEDPLAGLSSDPNAMMTPEDIAKLLEAMGQ